ncbi:FAD-dependent oxidoreductase [Dactylosporangium roseum]|uniref:FAD-dependent oxidoreductase n=1 Tax=Dactylosporangium roseum TaxID=47989 RepID=A0ABY5ZC52_9ACTN|nr:FAD-dependent oxidoreductase [Dactylosporangium roseum]UWZ38367.1 FAD-dependent oxidoreductase [Dactylosporangium roseum]
MTERLVVIGGDAAGMSAASQARKRRSPDDLNIVAFERGRHVSYSACGIPYLVAGDVEDADDLVARRPEEFRERQHIDLRLDSEVVAIDTDRREVTVRDAIREYHEPFDQLVIATGGEPIRPDVPGGAAVGIYGVQTLDDGVRILEHLDRHTPRRAVVVGGGYIGLEMAEAMIRHGLDVTLVDAAEQPMRTLDPDMGALVAAALEREGVRLRLGERLQGFGSTAGRVSAVHTSAGEIPADVVILGLGTRPNSHLAEAAGITVGETGGIRVDRRLRASADGVWAAGDCVENLHLVSQRPVAVALGTHANKQGRAVGINIGGGYATFPGVVGTAVSKLCADEVARTGLSTAEAEAAGFRTFSVVTESTTRAGYFPGAKKITTKIIAECTTGRFLGAQIVGQEGAAKRIDALAVALWHGMTVEEMTSLDLSYAPPFAPVWDPILIAARKAAEHLSLR